MRPALANVCFRVAARLAVLGARLQPPAPIAVQVTGMPLEDYFDLTLGPYREAAAIIAQSN